MGSILNEARTEENENELGKNKSRRSKVVVTSFLYKLKFKAPPL